jgi:hypothetical protein
VWFAVSSKGVSIVEADHPHAVYKFWSYREVANWGNTKQNFHLVAGNLQKPEKKSFTSAYSAHVRFPPTPSSSIILPRVRACGCATCREAAMSPHARVRLSYFGCGLCYCARRARVARSARNEPAHMSFPATVHDLTLKLTSSFSLRYLQISAMYACFTSRPGDAYVP